MLYKIEASKKKIWGKNNFFKKPSKELFNKIDFQGEEGDESKIANGNDASVTFIGESAQTPYTYIKITTNDATYYYYKQNMSGVLSMREQEMDDGTTINIYEYQHNFIIDTGNTWESDMFKILEQENPKVYFLRKLCNRGIDTGTGTKEGLYTNIKKQFGFTNALPVKADLNSCEAQQITNDTILTENGYDRTTGQNITLASVTSQSNPSMNIVKKIYVEYKIYDGSGHNETETITSFDNRSTRSLDQYTLKLTYKYGYSKKGISQIQLNYIEIYIDPNFSIANAETLNANIKQKTPDDTDTTYNKDMIWDSSNYKFYTQKGTLKSFTVADQSTTGYIDFNGAFSYTDNRAKADIYQMNTNQFAGSESTDKNKNYYIVCNQNVFNKNEAFATTSESGNIKNKNISYFIVPSMGDYSITLPDGTTQTVTKDQWFQATLNSTPYQKVDGIDKYSPIVIASDGIVTNVSCTLPPEIICQGRWFVAEQYIYDPASDKVVMIPIPFVAFDYYNDTSISYDIINIDKTDTDLSTGDETNEPYLLYSPQFVQYKIVNTSNDNLILPIWNYDLFFRQNGISAYLSVTDKIKLILDSNNFNNISEKSNIGDNYIINMSNPVIFETQAFNNGYVNNPTSETMGRQNFKEEQENFDIETNMLKRDNNLSLANSAIDTAGDFGADMGKMTQQSADAGVSGTGGMKAALTGLKAAKKLGQSVAKMVVGQQDFKDKMKKREISNNISIRNFENKFNSIRLSKSTINIGAYHTNALRNLTDGILLYKNEPLDEVKQAIMQEIYDYGYTYNAMDYFKTYKNRTLYNVVQLDTSFNLQDIYLSVENNYDSIFNTQSNIEGFITGLGAIKQILEQEPQDIDYSLNIEAEKPMVLELLIDNEYQLVNGTTITMHYKLTNNDVDITNDCTYSNPMISNIPNGTIDNIQVVEPGIITFDCIKDHTDASWVVKLEVDVMYHGVQTNVSANTTMFYGTSNVNGATGIRVLQPHNESTYTETNTLPLDGNGYTGTIDGITYTNGGGLQVIGDIPTGMTIYLSELDDPTQQKLNVDIDDTYTSGTSITTYMCYMLEHNGQYRQAKLMVTVSASGKAEIYNVPLGAKIDEITFDNDFIPVAGSQDIVIALLYGTINIGYNTSANYVPQFVFMLDDNNKVGIGIGNRNSTSIYLDDIVAECDIDIQSLTISNIVYKDSFTGDYITGDKDTRTMHFIQPLDVETNTFQPNSYVGQARVLYEV